jgi:hypothetical protein
VASGTLGLLYRFPGSHEPGSRSFPRPGARGQLYRAYSNSDVPVAAAEGMQSDVYNFRGVFHHALEFIAHGALEAGRTQVAQLRDEPGDPVEVGAASALVDGHDVHTSTVNV